MPAERNVAHESLYLDDIASQAVSAARALAERKGVSLVVGSFEESRIAGDAALVERLVLIVLDNAIKYTPPGGNVRLDVTARDGRRSVVVSDSGIGIPADQLPRIFERFYRAPTPGARPKAPDSACRSLAGSRISTTPALGWRRTPRGRASRSISLPPCKVAVRFGS
jgi:signal transduction histidine kinase